MFPTCWRLLPELSFKNVTKDRVVFAHPVAIIADYKNSNISPECVPI